MYFLNELIRYERKVDQRIPRITANAEIIYDLTSTPTRGRFGSFSLFKDMQRYRLDRHNLIGQPFLSCI